MACFLSRRPQNTFLWLILLKNKEGKNFQFLTKNHQVTPLGKCKIFDFFKWMFL